MVLFINVCLGQRVEVEVDGSVFTGTVKFKGCLNGYRGDWVGVELDKRVGDHDGMLKGRRYFQCMGGHGIFTMASKLRFIQTTRCLYNQYRTVVNPEDEFAEEVYESERPSPDNGHYDPILIDPVYERRALASSFPDIENDPYDRPCSYHLHHSVGSHIPAATMLRPQTARPRYAYHSRPLHYEYEPDYDDDYISCPSIPKTHMPYTALRDQVRRGWRNDRFVREMSVYNGRDSIKYNQWNDISA